MYLIPELTFPLKPMLWFYKASVYGKHSLYEKHRVATSVCENPYKFSNGYWRDFE